MLHLLLGNCVAEFMKLQILIPHGKDKGKGHLSELWHMVKKAENCSGTVGETLVDDAFVDPGGV